MEVNSLWYHDMFTLTAHAGHVFAGASLPFGMAKAVADVNDEDQGGFSFGDGNVTGYSHMHDSGTGGVSVTFSLTFSVTRRP